MDNQCKIISQIDDNKFLVECLQCGAQTEKTKEQISVFKHNKYCSKKWHEHIRTTYGDIVDRIFSAKFNHIKTKIHNFKGEPFTDFTEFYHDAFEDFMNAAVIYGIDNVSVIAKNDTIPIGKNNFKFINKR